MGSRTTFASRRGSLKIDSASDVISNRKTPEIWSIPWNKYEIQIYIQIQSAWWGHSSEWYRSSSLSERSSSLESSLCGGETPSRPLKSTLIPFVFTATPVNWNDNNQSVCFNRSEHSHQEGKARIRYPVGLERSGPGHRLDEETSSVLPKGERYYHFDPQFSFEATYWSSRDCELPSGSPTDGRVSSMNHGDKELKSGSALPRMEVSRQCERPSNWSQLLPLVVTFSSPQESAPSVFWS